MAKIQKDTHEGIQWFISERGKTLIDGQWEYHLEEQFYNSQ